MVERPDQGTIRSCRNGAHVGGRRADDHLHQRYHRKTKRRRPYPLRLPSEGSPGYGTRPRPTRRGYALLDDRHGVDDGAVGGVRHADPRQHDGGLRRRPRLSRCRQGVGAGGAARDHSPRRFANADPGAHAVRGGTDTQARSFVAEARRVHRRTMEPGAVALVLRERTRRPEAHNQLFRRHRDLRRHRHGERDEAAKTMCFLRSVARHGRRRGRRQRQPGAQSGRRAGYTQAVDRDDQGVLERPGSIHQDLLVAIPQRMGAWRLGCNRRRWAVVHPRQIGRRDKGGRQAAGSGGGRKRRGGSPGCGGSGSCGNPGSGQRAGPGAVLRVAPRSRALRESPPGTPRHGRKSTG